MPAAFQGTYTAIVSPFLNDELDDASYVRLLEHQIAGGVTGVVPVGTTGESPTVSHEEHLTLVRRAVEIAGGRCEVMAGAGFNDTRKSVAVARECADAGADALLLVAPYYNKPSAEGMFRHFGAVARATDLPVMLYSIPGRCGVEIPIETMRRLHAEFPQVCAVKEAGGTVERVSQMRQMLPKTFQILSGDDSLTLPFLSVGAVGVVSVASNVVPAEIVALVNHFTAGRTAEARHVHERLYPLFRELFVEPNPVPAKRALHRLGILASPEVRGPLCDPSPENAAKLDALFDRLGLPRTTEKMEDGGWPALSSR